MQTGGGELRRFRGEVNDCFTARADALFELIDGICSPVTIGGVAHVSLASGGASRPWRWVDRLLTALTDRHHPLHVGSCRFWWAGSEDVDGDVARPPLANPFASMATGDQRFMTD